MGQKVNPHGLRVGVIKDWDSKWYAEGDFADYLVEDYNIRTFLKKKLYAAGVSKIEIERASDRVKVIIYTACFLNARNLTLMCQMSEANTANAVFSQIRMRSAAELAAGVSSCGEFGSLLLL